MFPATHLKLHMLFHEVCTAKIQSYGQSQTDALIIRGIDTRCLKELKVTKKATSHGFIPTSTLVCAIAIGKVQSYSHVIRLGHIVSHEIGRASCRERV